MALVPPHPGFSPDTLAAVRRLSWVPVEGDAGELADGWLALAVDSGGGILWHAGEGAVPAGLRARFVSKDAFAAMREGEAVKGDVLVWNGQRFVLEDAAEGARQVARLVVHGSAT